MKARLQMVVKDRRGEELPVKEMWEKNGVQFFSVLGAPCRAPLMVRDTDTIKHYRVKA